MVCNVDIIFPGNYRQLNTSVFPHRKIWNAIIVIDRRHLWSYFFNWWPRKELKEKGIRIFMGFFILMELISAIANIYGRYNFAKSFLTSGIFGLVNAILFFWVIRMVNEMLTIAAQVYKTPDKKTLFINFEKVGQKVPPFFITCL
jgi:hypothetical protein